MVDIVDVEDSALRPMAATAGRDALKLVGAYLMLHGATNSEVQFFGGLATIVAAMLWSQGVSYLKHRELVNTKADVHDLAAIVLNKKQEPSK